VVREGDTPEKIARQYEVSVEALLRANGISDPRRLQVGQTLKIPPPDGR
jgi:LysM repeat protein